MTLYKVQLPADTNFAIQFKRRDQNEIWGPELRFKTIKNTLPPVKPSTPVVTEKLAQIIVTWDGKSFDGSAYLPDLNRVEIHMGLTDTFTPTTATMVDQFTIAGSTQQRQISDLTYGTTYYIKLVAVNSSEIRSEPSGEGHVLIRRISGIEIEDGSISIDKTDFTARGLRQTRQYNQPNPPSATNNPGNPPHYSDTWFDTDDKYRFYVYDHATPFRAQASNESWEAYYDANDAANDLGWREIPIGTANLVPGARVWYQPTDPAPTATPPPVDGDIWFRTNVQPGGTNARTWKGGQWNILQWGQGSLGPGSVVADNIVANAITAGKIDTNAVTADKISAGEILARHIQSGQITADKVGTNQIIAYSANIANGVIDDLKVANVSAGKIITGALTATVSLTSGLIRTAATGNRTEFDNAGLRLYNSAGAVTFNAQSSSGYATLTGNIVARTFRSQGYASGGTGYIEMGDTGPIDPTDEVRMYTSGSISSMRNPTDRPGFVRISTSTQGTRDYVGVYDLGPNAMYIPGSIGKVQAGANISFNLNTVYISANQGGVVKIQPAGNPLQALFVEGANNNAVLLRNGSVGFRKVSIKLPQDEEQVQIRNGDDNDYADLVVRNINIRGTQTGGSAGGSYPTNASFSNITTSGLTVYNTVSAQGYTTSGSVTAYNVETQGNVYAHYEIYADNNITSRSSNGFYAVNGSFFARGGFYPYSNPDRKTNIRKLNVDAVSLLSNTEMYAWDWADGEDESAGSPGIGLMTSELPYMATPDALEPGGNGVGDNYNLVVTGALTVQAVRQIDTRVVDLEAQVADLKAKLDALTPPV